MPLKYKVLVVDDSSFMRQFVCDYLAKEPSLEVMGTACNGEEAIKMTLALKPDVITMDIEMPVVNGLDALKEIMLLCPTPVVMLSNYTQEGADATFKALELGAVDFVSKPSGTISPDLDIVENEIIEKVKAAAQVSLKKFNTGYHIKPLQIKPTFDPGRELKKIVAIGTSTGGPRALATIMADLPKNLEAGIVIVQHMPEGFTRSLAERLDSFSQLKVMEAKQGDELLPGLALVAPAGAKHLTIKRRNDRFYVHLEASPPISGHRPSVDVMMNSVARSGLYTLGVLLTGMGFDGAVGMENIKDNNGDTIAEDSLTSIIFGMPKVAIERNAVKYVLPLNEISLKIAELVFRNNF